MKSRCISIGCVVLFFGTSLLARNCAGQAIVIDTGIDTILAQAGLNGPDTPHGEAGANPDGVEAWEWDGSDNGGVNQGLLWMDIPQNVLNNFSGTATLALHILNNGNAANMHRITTDWLSGPDGGDQVTWNNIPGGPGIVPGTNAEMTANTVFPDSIGREGQVIFVDVTADLLAWAGGKPNYGWGFIPAGGDGTGISSFEHLDNPVPTLTIINQVGVFPDERLDGPLGGAGTWGVIDYYGNFTATEPAVAVVQQILDIQKGTLQASSATTQVPYLDITDPDTTVDGGPTLTTAPFPYAANNLTPTSPDDDDIISVAHGRIRVAEAGTYTFNVHSDDGFAFRIRDAAFEKVGGNGTIDVQSNDTILHSGNTGDSNTRGVVQLEARDYDVEFMSWERGGGAFYELTSQKGDFATTGRDLQPQWLAVGDPREVAGRSEPLDVEGVAFMTKAMTVKNFNNVDPADQPLEFAREYAFDRADAPDAEGDMNLFVIEDHAIAPGGCPFGRYNHDGVNVEQWPNSRNGQAVDNFISLITGAFQVDDGDATAGEQLEITIHVDSDDRAYFRVIGQDFLDWDNQQLFSLDGDEVMWGDANVCNTDFSAVIMLTEGVEYEFEALHVEAGGDAGMQVLAGIGDLLFAADLTEFSPLIYPEGSIVTYARNIGLQMVAETAGDPCDFDGNGTLGVGDINLLLAAVNAGTNNPTFDINKDGSVNEADISVLVTSKDKLNTYIGDANLDGQFNSTDFVDVFLAGEYEDATNDNSTWEEGDWNGDLDFTSSDFVAAFLDGGYELGPRASVSAVPEPSSIVLTLVGLIAWLGIARRRRS